MLETIEGTVVERGEEILIVQVGGFGLRLWVPPRTVAESLGKANVRLFTHLLVRDDGYEIYGFATREEREMFVGLFSVPQLGPRLAFRLVSALPPEELATAVRTGNLSVLNQVKGIGARTAQRVIVELSGRLAKMVPPTPTPLGEKEQVVIRALSSKALGFSEMEARKALDAVRKECSDDAPVEEMIRRALGILSSS
ncbi:MAG: Holliday junction branch migration protein RuvA [Candidatus Bipolaricaulota bacterium]